MLCAFRLDLTNNTCGEGLGTSLRIQNLLKTETVDKLFENIASLIDNKEDRQRFRIQFNRQSLLDRYNEGTTKVSITYRRLADNGDIHWVATHLVMFATPQNESIEAVAYSEDVDHGRKDESIIKEIANHQYDYISLVDVPRNIFHLHFFAPQFKNLKSYDKMNYDEAIHLSFEKSLVENKQEAVYQQVSLDYVVEQLKNSKEYSYVYNCIAEGEKRYKQLNFSYLDGEEDTILLTRYDITEAFIEEQKQKEQMENAMLEAEKANDMKTSFLSNVSHDMRTPLNAILGYTDLAQSSEDVTEVHDYLKKISKTGSILLRLINDTLDLSKIETGAITLKKSPINVKDLEDRILSSIMPSLEEKRIHFEINSQTDKALSVNVDAVRVQEIFINILSNAIKFTPEGGHVTIAVTNQIGDDECYVKRVVISDYGVGMSASFLPHIFEPFTQERTQETASIEGSGLGLSIVKRLVDMMGGTITVRSVLHEGTTFVVTLPFEKVEETVHIKEEKLPYETLYGLHVLLCEDNIMNSEIARKLLEEKGILVTLAQTGKEGLDLFKQSPLHEYSAILMDIRVPVMNGYEASNAIRHLDRRDALTVPIIAMTADAYAEDIQHQLYVHGKNGHVAKPIDPKKLFTTLIRSINGNS